MIDFIYILIVDKTSYSVTLELGAEKTYMARVYKYNESGEKIYSDYSSEVVVENKN